MNDRLLNWIPVADGNALLRRCSYAGLLLGCLLSTSVSSAEEPGQASVKLNFLEAPEILLTAGEIPPVPVASEAKPDLGIPPLPAVEGEDESNAGIDPPETDLHDFEYYSGPNGNSHFAPPVQYNHGVPEAEEPFLFATTEAFLHALESPAVPMADFYEWLLHSEHVHPHTELDHHAIGIQAVPERPPLLLELNEDFLGPGFLEQGIELPTGAVWRPAFWVFGNFRTGVNYFDNGGGADLTEQANRLDLFGQLNLSGTERLLVGLRPLDEETGAGRAFTGYDLRDGDSLDAWNAEIQTLFFEGDFGEIFPNLDPYDTKALDYGFSVGRQPMSFQQGLLLNEDRIDALTITRNTLNGGGILNFRGSFVYAWNEVNRHNLLGGNPDDRDGQLIGFFTETDIYESTINADVAYTWSDNNIDDLIVFGVSGIQRINGFHNTYNSSLHFLASFPTNDETPLAGQGELLFHQFSWTPHHTNDLIFLNTFWGIDQFTSASRGTLAGGPLGQAGLLFSATGLGRYGAPLNNQATNVAGGSLGYQLFFNDTREQVVFEIGGRQDTDGADNAAIATGMRYQKALDQHWFFIIDTFVTKREADAVGQGLRFEMQSKF